MSEIPVFPLPLVLFPGGRLPLQIFETRYLDMVKRCMREDSGFGIVMIEEGDQVIRREGEPLPQVSGCGTYGMIVDFDQLPNGMLSILVEGRRKFRILDSFEQADRLMMANVEYLEPEDDGTIPEHHEHLSGLLVQLMEHEAVRRLGIVCDLQSASDVGARLTELLPCPNDFKQRMLEMTDPLARLRELDKLVERMSG